MYSGCMVRLGLGARVFAVTVVSFSLSLFPGRDGSLLDEVYRDALLMVREPVPVAREILVVPVSVAGKEAESELDPVDLIWILAELRADRVLLPRAWADREPLAPDMSAGLDQEFARIDENIVTLFEAIRIGAIAPGEAERFVGELRHLVGQSQSRILEMLLGDPRGDRVSLDDLVESFGSDRLGRDLADLGVVLPRFPEGRAVPLPPRVDGGGTAFRVLPAEAFSRYGALVRQLDTSLAALEEAGYFDEIDPVDRPGIMGDHGVSLRREFYQRPTERGAALWQDAMEEYFRRVGALIDPGAEARLMERLGAFAETEDLDPESAAGVREMKDELGAVFRAVRRDYGELVALRADLARAVEGAFVIPEDDRLMVANSVLVGTYGYAPEGRDRILLLTAAGLLVGLLLAPFRLSTAVVLAPFAAAAGAAIFPLLFLAADIWVDPLPVTVVIGGAVAVSIIVAALAQGALERALTGAGAVRLPRRVLRGAVLRGGLSRKRLGRRVAAVVVVAAFAEGGAGPGPGPGLGPGPGTDRDGGPGRGPGTRQLRTVHRVLARRIRRAGGIVVGDDGPMVFAAFDDPRGAHRACRAAMALAAGTLPGGLSIHCGVDAGDLDYYLSPVGGYRATGPAVTYARRFCELARKHHRRILLGDRIVTAAGPLTETERFEEKGKLVVSSSGTRYAYYTLTETDLPPP